MIMRQKTVMAWEKATGRSPWRLLVVVLCMSVTSVVWAATTAHWAKSDTGTSPQTAADYTNESFWIESAVPNGTADIAYFSNAYTDTRYIKLPDSLVLKQSIAKRGSADCTTTFIGQDVTLTDRLTFEGSYGPVQRWFANITAPNGLTLIHSGVFGKLSFGGANKALTFSGGCCTLDFGAFAESDAVMRSDDLLINKVTVGSGNIYFRGPAALTAPTTGVWRVASGSPYLTWVSGVKGSQLAVGGALSGTGIPVGAFVRRVFSDCYVEMSAPGAADVDSSVTFATFVPEFVAKIPTYSMSGNNPTQRFEKRSPAANVRFEFGTFSTLSATYAPTFTADTGFYPATVVIRDASSLNCLVLADRAHFEFAANPNGASGFPAVRGLRLGSTANSDVRLTVTNGIAARVSAITNLVGVLTKDGVGMLTARMDGANAGTLFVEEGVFELSAADASVGTLKVATGATMRVPEGLTLSAGTLSAEAGAILEGPGTIAVTGTTMPDLSEVILTSGIRIAIPGAAGDPVVDVPEATNPAGDPVFWVDASKESSLVKDGTTGAVSRWNDCRGAGYLFATNVIHSPTWTDGTYGPYVNFVHSNASKTHYVTNEQVLVWSELVKNIKVVFAVLDATSEGGYLLGSSSRSEIQNQTEVKNNGGFFYRANSGWSAPILGSKSRGTGDRLYIDGDEEDLGTCFLSQGVQLVEYHNLSNRKCWADAFGTGFIDGGGEWAANGGLHAYEYVIYTNALTLAERTVTAQYLLKKWKKRDVTITENQDNEVSVGAVNAAADGGLLVAPDETLTAEIAAGTLCKTGGGTLFVKKATGGALQVVAGTAVIRSQGLDAEGLPKMSDCWLHFDASLTSSVSCVLQNGTNFVTRWDDRRGNGWYMVKAEADSSVKGVQTDPGWLHENVMNGLPMVDLGEMAYASSGGFAAPTPFRALQFMTPSGEEVSGHQHNGMNGPKIYSTFIVYDSSGGGNALLSARGYGYADKTYGFAPNHATAGALPNKIFHASTVAGLNSVLNTQLGNWDKKVLLPVRQNGVAFSPYATAFSGSQDVFTFSLEDYPRKTSGLALEGYDNYAGGLMYGEVLLFTNYIGGANTRLVEKYLMKKWKGVDDPDYVAATLDALSVEADAKVKICGNSPLTVASLAAGGGTVEGALKLAKNAVLEVPVLSDGTLGTVTLGANVDLSAGCLVRLVGNVETVKPGTHVIVSSPSVVADQAVWTFEVPAAKHRTYVMSVVDGAVRVTVGKLGMMLIVR